MKDAVQDLLDEVSGPWEPTDSYWAVQTPTCTFHVDERTWLYIRDQWQTFKEDTNHLIDFSDVYGGQCVTTPGSLYNAFNSTPELRRRSRLEDAMFKAETIGE